MLLDISIKKLFRFSGYNSEQAVAAGTLMLETSKQKSSLLSIAT